MAITSKQIAELAGVSRGTVDRALHNRGRVNPEVAERIRRIAHELDYQPNPIGRALVSTSRDLKIGVILQSIETPTVQTIAKGVLQAETQLKSQGIALITREVCGLDTAAVLRAIDELTREGISGLALSANNAPALRERIDALHEAGIPVITLNSDAPDSARICFIGMDNFRAGQTAAGLMHLLLPAGGKVFPLTGYLDSTAHIHRLAGFSAALTAEKANIDLIPAEPCFDRDDLAYAIVRRVVMEFPDLAGIYVACNGQLGACNAVREMGKAGQVRVIAFDLTAPNDALLRSGDISVLLDQDAFAQGYRPPLLLHDYLVHKQKPEKPLLYTNIDVCTKYNTGDCITTQTP